MTVKLPIDIGLIKGFLDPDEGETLYRHALEAATLAPCLEVGSYCGKSTVYLGSACKAVNSILYAVDHHRGSEEHQPGEEYHDESLFDADEKLVDTFREFRRTLKIAGLEENVVPIVAPTRVASKRWVNPLGMVFIDGGHSMSAAQTDYRAWVQFIVPGGVLAIHDLFPDPSQGGQAPITIYRLALASGMFEELPGVKTLGLLRRVN